MTIRTLGIHALVLAGIIGCRQGDLGAGLSDSSFVAVVATLRRIDADDTRDSVRRIAARDSVLQSRDLTVNDLEAAARALSEDPDRAVAVWQRIMKQSPIAPGR